MVWSMHAPGLFQIDEGQGTGMELLSLDGSLWEKGVGIVSTIRKVS